MRSCRLLSGLRRSSLTRLNLSFNLIESLAGLRALETADCPLRALDFRGNRIARIEEFAHLAALPAVRHLRLGGTTTPNPVCRSASWRESVFNSVPFISTVDGEDRHGNSVNDESELDSLLALFAPFPSSKPPSHSGSENLRPAVTAVSSPAQRHGDISQDSHPPRVHSQATATVATSRHIPITVATPRIDEALRTRRERASVSPRNPPPECVRTPQRSYIPRPTTEAKVRPLQGGPVAFTSEDEASAGPAVLPSNSGGSPSSNDDALDDNDHDPRSNDREVRIGLAEANLGLSEPLVAIVGSAGGYEWLPGEGPDAVDEMLGEELATERDRRSRAEYTARLLIQKVPRLE